MLIVPMIRLALMKTVSIRVLMVKCVAAAVPNAYHRITRLSAAVPPARRAVPSSLALLDIVSITRIVPIMRPAIA